MSTAQILSVFMAVSQAMVARPDPAFCYYRNNSPKNSTVKILYFHGGLLRNNTIEEKGDMISS